MAEPLPSWIKGFTERAVEHTQVRKDEGWWARAGFELNSIIRSAKNKRTRLVLNTPADPNKLVEVREYFFVGQPPVDGAGSFVSSPSGVLMPDTPFPLTRRYEKLNVRSYESDVYIGNDEFILQALTLVCVLKEGGSLSLASKECARQMEDELPTRLSTVIH